MKYHTLNRLVSEICDRHEDDLLFPPPSLLHPTSPSFLRPIRTLSNDIITLVKCCPRP